VKKGGDAPQRVLATNATVSQRYVKKRKHERNFFLSPQMLACPQPITPL